MWSLIYKSSFIKLPVNEWIGGVDEAAVFVLTAAILLPPEPPAADHTNSLLSFPPDANHWLSGDHFKPQTSCRWPTKFLSG